MNRILLRQGNDWHQFDLPVRIICAQTLVEVLPALQAAELAAAAGLHAVGFVTYEAASAFDPALIVHARGVLPLVWFGVYAEAEMVEPPVPVAHSEPAVWQLATGFDDYSQRLDHIHQALQRGDTYQVNHTERLYAPHADVVSLFRQVAPDARYAALIETDAFTIMSASPELFFRLDGTTITCEPMKGTAARRLAADEDQLTRQWLVSSGKNQAENVMITDMVRNDLGRIAQVGSVGVSDLFAVQRLRSVWQMTSTVTATTTASVSRIFAALFPGASVTGAPKAASMRMIRQLEDTPREIYTGVIGRISPDRQACFSIAIRTAWTDRVTGRSTYGAGGGIVWDSEPRDEFAELLAKTRLLDSRILPRFGLLETLLWTPHNGWFLRRQHLQRLIASAEYFSRKVDLPAVDRALDAAVQGRQQSQRVRLVLDDDGHIDVTAVPHVITSPNVACMMVVSGHVDAADVFMYHKTTHRSRYEHAGAGQEVLLVDDRGRITESTIANVVYRLDGQLYTPPVSDGLLPGTFRAWMLELGVVRERSLTLQELDRVGELMLVNSIRGERRVDRLLTVDGKDLFPSNSQPLSE